MLRMEAHVIDLMICTQLPSILQVLAALEWPTTY